jgi:hypothetical protein
MQYSEECFLRVSFKKCNRGKIDFIANPFQFKKAQVGCNPLIFQVSRNFYFSKRLTFETNGKLQEDKMTFSESQQFHWIQETCSTSTLSQSRKLFK